MNIQSEIFTSFLITLVAGAATAIGAGMTFFIKRNDFKLFALGMSFSAGVMVYLSFMDIMPMATRMICDGNASNAGMGEKPAQLLASAMFFAGVLAAACIDYFIPEHVGHEMMDKNSPESKCRQNTGRVGLMTAIALGVHNFPEGLSVFVTSMENVALGISVGIAIMLHNIPEGVSVALPIYNATGDKKKAFWTAALSGLAEPAGAIAAYFILVPYLTPALVGSAMAVTAGIMIFISLDELLPMAKEYGHEHYGIVGAFLGMFIMSAVSYVF